MAGKAYLGVEYEKMLVTNEWGVDHVISRAPQTIIYNAEDFGDFVGCFIHIRCERATTSFFGDEPLIEVYLTDYEGYDTHIKTLSKLNGWELDDPLYIGNNSGLKLVFTDTAADYAAECHFYGVEIINLDRFTPQMVRAGCKKDEAAVTAALSIKG